MARSVVDYLISRGIEGADLLEVGGGIGDLQLELLRAGVSRSVNIELSPEYEEEAAELVREAAMGERVSRHVGDFVEARDGLDAADIVVLNRVVCCYPWVEKMMEAAVGKTRRYLGLTFPREKWWMKLVIGVGNSWMSIRQCDFRGFVHPVAGIESVATRAGLIVGHRDRNLGWQAVVFERAV